VAKPQEDSSDNSIENNMLLMAFGLCRQPLVPSKHGRIASVPHIIERACSDFPYKLLGSEEESDDWFEKKKSPVVIIFLALLGFKVLQMSDRIQIGRPVYLRKFPCKAGLRRF
jgi:hypothetical protein